MTDTRTNIPTSGTLVVVTCWCGCQHAIPRALNSWANEDERRTVYCPLGHQWVCRESNANKLAAAQARNQHLEDQLHAAEADAEATRVRLLRDRHRFANGVCPCCNRSFENVRRHMETLHPDYDASEVSLPAPLRYKCSCGRSFETPRGLAVHQGRQRSGNWTDPNQGTYWRHLTVMA